MMQLTSKTLRLAFGQRGQGMAEFAVAGTFFLVPLLIGVTWLARLESSQQHLQQAARYAAWERTVWYRNSGTYNTKSDTDVAREISMRVIAPHQNAIDTSRDRQPAGAGPNRLDPFLYTPDYSQGNSQAMIKPTGPQQALVQVGSSSRSEGNLSAAAINTVSRFGLNLQTEGIATSTVASQIQVIPSIASTNVLPANFSANTRNALLSGAWNANGPGDVERRVKRTVPTDFVDDVPGFDILQTIAGFLFPEFNELDLGHVDANQTPCQRTTGVPSKQRKGSSC